MCVCWFVHLPRPCRHSLLEQKPARLAEYKKESKERMIELAEFFSGEKALTRIKKDDNLQGWFNNLATEIEALDFERAILAVLVFLTFF